MQTKHQHYTSTSAAALWMLEERCSLSGALSWSLWPPAFQCISFHRKLFQIS
jgi:hypothetical protein